MKFFCSFALLLAFVFSANAQQIHPQVQAMIDEMNAWVQQEIKAKGTIDQDILNKKSARIKEVQDSLLATQPKVGEVTGTAVSVRKFTKTLFAGSSVTVPENKEWRITGMYVKSDANPYRVKVQSVHFKPVYQPGEKISAPVMSSESALLTNDAMSTSYDLDIEETVFGE